MHRFVHRMVSLSRLILIITSFMVMIAPGTYANQKNSITAKPESLSVTTTANIDLVYPVQSTSNQWYISQGYNTLYHGGNDNNRADLMAIDLAERNVDSQGRNVVAAADGIVWYLNNSQCMVVLKHGDLFTSYLHVRPAQQLAQDQSVQGGHTVIGTMELMEVCGGTTYGAHVHFMLNSWQGTGIAPRGFPFQSSWQAEPFLSICGQRLDYLGDSQSNQHLNKNITPCSAPPQPAYQFAYVRQNVPSGLMKSGDQFTLSFILRNTGTETWRREVVKLGTDSPSPGRDNASPFYNIGLTGWQRENRIYMKETSVAPGQEATFEAVIRAPTVPGTYREYFRPVAEQITWMEAPNPDLWFEVAVSGGNDPSSPEDIYRVTNNCQSGSSGGYCLDKDPNHKIKAKMGLGKNSAGKFYVKVTIEKFDGGEFGQGGSVRIYDNDRQTYISRLDPTSAVTAGRSRIDYTSGGRSKVFYIDPSYLQVNEENDLAIHLTPNDNSSMYIDYFRVKREMLADLQINRLEMKRQDTNMIVSPGGSIPTGTRIGVTVYTQNCGGGDVTADFQIKYYDNGNNIADDIEVATISAGCNDIEQESASWAINQIGVHKIRVCIDTTNQVAESNENNNCSEVQLTVVQPPTATPTATGTNTPTATSTLTPTGNNTPTATNTETSTPTATNTPAPPATNTPTLSFTNTTTPISITPTPDEKKGIIKVTGGAVAPNNTLLVPIAVDALPTERKLGAVTLEIRYNPEVISISRCMNNPEQLFDLVQCNTNTSGLIILSAISTNGLTNRGKIAEIDFQAVGSAGATTSLATTITTFTDAHGGPIPFDVQSTPIVIAEYLKGDVSCDKISNAVDALFILQYGIRLRNPANQCPLPVDTLLLPGCDVNNNQNCDAVDALFILQCTVKITNSFCPIQANPSNRWYSMAGDAVLSVGSQTAAPNSTVTIPVTMTVNSGRLGAATIEIHYDPAVVKPVNCLVNPQGHLDSVLCNINFERDGNKPDVISFSALSLNGITAKAHLVNLIFEAVGQADSTTDLTAVISLYSDTQGADLTTQVQHGQIKITTVTAPTPSATSTPIFTTTATATAVAINTPTATAIYMPSATPITPTPLPTHTPIPTATTTVIAMPTLTLEPATATPTMTAVSVTISETGGVSEVTLDRLQIAFALPPDAVNESIRLTIEVADSPPATNGFQVLNQIFTINAVTGNGAPVTQFAKPFTLTIRYNDTAVQGLDEHQLALHYWHETQQVWIAIPTTVDADNNLLTATLDHLTTFAVLQTNTDNPQRLFLPMVQR